MTLRRMHVEALENRIVLSAASPSPPALEDVIVVFDDQVADPATTAQQLISAHQGKLGHQFQHVLNGFSARLPKPAIEALARNPRVQFIEPDAPAFLTAETLPTGVDRVDAELNPLGPILNDPANGVEILVATIDTGVDKDHPDLNVAGGRNFVRTEVGDDNYNDGNGHGTHVAGIIGAVDNEIGVEGAAPRAGIWAFRSFGNNGSGTASDVVAAMEEILVQRDAGNNISVANMSFAFMIPPESIRIALENLATDGVVCVAAAGNFGGWTSMFPGRDPHTLSVAALADSDGLPGGLGPETSAGPDDTLADFSNSGNNVDIAAPGVDILSTYKGGRYKEMSGTSMAAPHVSGAAAMFITEYADAWTTGVPQDALDVALVFEGLLQTAWAAEQLPQPNGSWLPVLDSSGSWQTVPVASIHSIDGVEELGATTLVSGFVPIQIDARDVDTSALEVTVQIDGQAPLVAVYQDGTGFYEVLWDTTAENEGQHEIIVFAGDGEYLSNPGARLTVNNVDVIVDNDVAPTVDLVYPGADSTVEGEVVLQATASDDIGVTQVDFIISDGVDETILPGIETDGVWTATWGTTFGADGSYTVTAMATDTIGQTTSHSADNVVVDNEPVAGDVMFVGDLDGEVTTMGGSGKWRAAVDVLIVDAALNPIGGAVVHGDWTGAVTILDATATTGANGLARLATGAMKGGDTVAFEVKSVSHVDFAYDSAANTDPDGDSDGTTIVLYRTGTSQAGGGSGAAAPSTPSSLLWGPFACEGAGANSEGAGGLPTVSASAKWNDIIALLNPTTETGAPTLTRVAAKSAAFADLGAGLLLPDARRAVEVSPQQNGQKPLGDMDVPSLQISGSASLVARDAVLSRFGYVLGSLDLRMPTKAGLVSSALSKE